MRLKGKFLFDNQLLVLNSFFPQGDLTEREVMLLYADGSKGKNLVLCLTDVTTLDNIDFHSKLIDVDFRDTYYDQPFVYHMKLLEMILQAVYIQEFDKQKMFELYKKVDEQPAEDLLANPLAPVQ